MKTASRFLSLAAIGRGGCLRFRGAAGIAKKRNDLVMDGIGDAIVVLTILAAQHGVNIEACIAMAYDEIKDRKGKMIDGVFVKEADL